jgi:hypothetical protein
LLPFFKGIDELPPAGAGSVEKLGDYRIQEAPADGRGGNLFAFAL